MDLAVTRQRRLSRARDDPGRALLGSTEGQVPASAAQEHPLLLERTNSLGLAVGRWGAHALGLPGLLVAILLPFRLHARDGGARAILRPLLQGGRDPRLERGTLALAGHRVRAPPR